MHGVMISAIISSLSIVVLSLHDFHFKGKGCRLLSALYTCIYFDIPPAGQSVLISTGIVGSVVVFPIGLALLFISCCSCCKKKSDDIFHKEFHDCMLFTSQNQQWKS